jgi:hypothetical protein
MQRKKARRRALCGTLSTFLREDEVGGARSKPQQTSTSSVESRDIGVTHSDSQLVITQGNSKDSRPAEYHPIIPLLSLALGLVAASILFQQLWQRLVFEFSSPSGHDSSVYWAVGRGITNGLAPWKDLFDNTYLLPPYPYPTVHNRRQGRTALRGAYRRIARRAVY